VGADVSAIEMDPLVAQAARMRLRRNGTAAVEVAVGDPYFGWPRPGRIFDAIVVRLAMDYLPATLVRQLAPGGRMIIPIGRSDIYQELTLVTKNSHGEVTRRRVMQVLFTRLPGGPRI
jgi:protein-L-isoaspartate(D-aspartate) O-methyltransferase